MQTCIKCGEITAYEDGWKAQVGGLADVATEGRKSRKDWHGGEN